MNSTSTPKRRRMLIAVVLPPLLVLSMMAALELALILAGVAPSRSFFLREFGEDGREYFVRSSEPPLVGSTFRVEAFTVAKRPGTRRVICLGGSTTQGHPFEPPVPFADWLQARLPVLLPEEEFEVLNLGSNGWNAEAVADLVVELAAAEPDLLVLYSGHNEFLLRNLPQIREESLHRIRRVAGRMRLGRLLLTWFAGGSESGAWQAEFANAVAVHEVACLSDAELSRGYRRYRQNVEQLLRHARNRGVEVVLCLPVSDLRDTGPEYSSFSATTAAEDRQLFLQLLASIRADREQLEDRRTSLPPAELLQHGTELLSRLDHLHAIDGNVEVLPYERARVLLLLDRPVEARGLFLQARDGDGHPIRATGRLHGILQDLAEEYDAALADPRGLFDAADPVGVPGQDHLFVDNCHPDVEGHRLIGEALVRGLAEGGVFAATSKWLFDAEPSVEEYRQRMGYDPTAMAGGLARWGLFALGKTYFNPQRQGGVLSARVLFELALKCDPDCVPAHGGLAIVAAVQSNSDGAWSHLKRAFAKDVKQARGLVERIERQPVVRELFEKLGIEFQAGEPVWQ
jgi:hypothetical protein